MTASLEPVLFDIICEEFDMDRYEMTNFINTKCGYHGSLTDLICKSEMYIGCGLAEEIREKLGVKDVNI